MVRHCRCTNADIHFGYAAFENMDCLRGEIMLKLCREHLALKRRVDAVVIDRLRDQIARDGNKDNLPST